MTSRIALAVAALLAGAGAVARAGASELALPLLERCRDAACPAARSVADEADRGFLRDDPAPRGEANPTLILAQRAIERSWGASDDSVYVVHEIPDWRSEGFAIALSSAVPGLGQAYAGEARRGLMFAAAEAAGWIVRQIHAKRGDDLRDQAALFAGTPTDSASAWSFARFAGTTDEESEIEALYTVDPDAFYDRIATDPRYASGWGVDHDQQRRSLIDLREISDHRLRMAHYAEVGLWLNHLVAAVDALRSARQHNLPLIPKLGIRVKSGWRSGGPAVTALIERRF
jgi:hypothetical protein